MTDKEQIIIHGVDVSECLFYQSNFEEDYDVKIKHFCSNWHNSCESANNSNCYFKQLARKTQECEELKKLVVRCSEGWGKEACMKNWYQQSEQAKQEENHDLTMKLYGYRKALEEIERLANENNELLQGYHHEWANNKLILEIISKATGEE